ncbi:MAG: ceramidase domain-containing protein [Pirellula sp.]|jgi:hypothetical protein
MTVPNSTHTHPSHGRSAFWIHSIPWGTTCILILLLVCVAEFYRGKNIWSDWVASPELRRSNYAEVIHAQDLFRTRANTWSNLAYVVVGIYAICFGIDDARQRNRTNRNYLIDTPAMSLLFGTACCYLGFGSGLFHASLTRWGQQLDVGSMYAPLLACIAINLGRYAPALPLLGATMNPKTPVPTCPTPAYRVPTWPILVVGVIAISYLLYHYKWSMSSGQVLPLHIAIVTGFAIADCVPNVYPLPPHRPRRYRIQRWWLAVALVSLILAVACRQIDVAGNFSSPESWCQGHAIWHILTAASLGSMYLYYRSESADGLSAGRSAHT